MSMIRVNDDTSDGGGRHYFLEHIHYDYVCDSIKINRTKDKMTIDDTNLV